MIKVPHNCPTLGDEEKLAAVRVLDSGWVAQGSEVGAFESELCEFFNIPDGHALVVSSGSSALYLALGALNAENKRIGLPTYACSALRNAIGLIRGKCVYLDCSSTGPNVDISQALLASLDILIAPSMYGIPIDLPPKRNFKLIEDIAQSMGAIASGQRIGLRGDLGICSFYASKMITSGGQGGAIISKDKSLIDVLRDYREFDIRKDPKYRFNFQMTDLQAAIGRVQLKKLPIFLKRREEIFELYRQDGLSLIECLSPINQSSYYRAIIMCNDPSRVIQALENANIRAIVPIAEWELLDNLANHPVADYLTRNTVSLPIYPSLRIDEAKKISNIVKGIK
jgi:perosamine synthetase